MSNDSTGKEHLAPNEWTPSIPAWVRDARLTGMETATLVSLLWFTDRHGMCFPSARQCLATVSMSRDAWFRNLRSLEEKGVLTRASRVKPNGAKSSNGYRVNLLGPQSGRRTGVVRETDGM